MIYAVTLFESHYFKIMVKCLLLAEEQHIKAILSYVVASCFFITIVFLSRENVSIMSSTYEGYLITARC